MWKTVLAGALALATIGSLSVSSEGVRINTAQAQEVVVTDGQIARLRHALRLTPSQQHHWYAVEATLRSLARQQQRYRVASSEAGYFGPARAQVAGYPIPAVSWQRLRSAAQPLIASLSEEQKESGRSVLSSMGVSF